MVAGQIPDRPRFGTVPPPLPPYRVYRNGDKHFQEICELDNSPIHTLELPDGMKLDKSSYEVLLRYVLVDVVHA